jgi:hypothetical protein
MAAFHADWQIVTIKFNLLPDLDQGVVLADNAPLMRTRL